MTLLAYHNDPSLKRDMLAELAEHRKMDQIIKGTYAEGSNGDFKGCAVGCSIHSLNRKRGTKYAYASHEAYEAGFGIPRQLAYLEDRIFENLADGKHLKWPERFMKAITPGADLSLVMPKFIIWLLIDDKDGVIQFATREDTKEGINGVADLYQRKLKGEDIIAAQWESAHKKAYAADAAAAYADAYADADAAAAAAAAAYAAAYAAADAAAYAAAADARQKHWQKMADKLIELLEAA